MPDETKNGMQCAEFEALLGDALDHHLTESWRVEFESHARVCAVCGPLLREAEAGRSWLKSLQMAEPPTGLVHNILLATTGQESRRVGAQVAGVSWWGEFVQTVAAPALAFVRQPRFAMSFGMAFFAVSICMSLAGVKITDVHAADFRPSTIKRNYYETSGRVVKYYDNIRFVYEIESRVREFKRMTAPAEPAPENPETKGKDRGKDTSGRPDPKQDRNYGQSGAAPMLAQSSQLPSTVSNPGRPL